MKYLLLLFSGFILQLTGARAQSLQAGLDIQFNKNILQPGDSLSVTINYSAGTAAANKQSLATLELIIESELGQRTRLRWPMINGEASGVLQIPASLPEGRYSLIAGLQQRFFEVAGQVRDAKNIGSIQAMLLTKRGEWDEQQVTVQPDGTFRIRNWLFEDNALLAFAANNSRRTLDIRISTRLDSSSAPLAVAGRYFYVGNPSPSQKQSLSGSTEIATSAFADKATLLPAVLVQTTTKSIAQQFNDEYVSALFRSGNERMISIMDDPAAIGSRSILNYLQGRVAGLQITSTGASWRGGPVAFFLDEMRVDAQTVSGIPITDIAIVKAFPPPFFGSFGGGAAVAVYTRRGGEMSFLPANRQVFRVRGYTPSAVTVDMNRLLL